MYQSTLRFLENFTLQFSTLLKLYIYDQMYILTLQTETERRERDYSERTNFSASASLSYVDFLLTQYSQVMEDYYAKHPGQRLPVEVQYSRRRASKVAQRYLRDADLEQCLSLIRLLTKHKQLSWIGPMLFDQGIARFPNKALFYCLKAANLKDISLARRMFQLNYSNMDDYEQTYTFFGNWLQLEVKYIVEMLPAGVTADKIEDEALRAIAEGSLIIEVLKLALLQLAGHAIAVDVLERERIRLIQLFGRNLAWKLTALPDSNDILTIAPLVRSLYAYELVVGDDFRYHLKNALQQLHYTVESASERLQAESIAISHFYYERGAEYALNKAVDESQSDGMFGED